MGESVLAAGHTPLSIGNTHPHHMRLGSAVLTGDNVREKSPTGHHPNHTPHCGYLCTHAGVATLPGKY